MAIKNAIFRKKIGNTIYELLMKTSENMVYLSDDSTTLATKLANMDSAIADAAGKLTDLLGNDAAKSIAGQISTAVGNLEDALTDETDATSLAGKIAAIQDANTGILANAQAYTDGKIGINYEQYATVKAYVDAIRTELSNTISGAFHFKGTKNYYDQLPSTGQAEGDVWQVAYAGTTADAGTTQLQAEYAWNGTAWVELGSILDLSSYSTTTEVQNLINNKVGTIPAQVGETVTNTVVGYVDAKTAAAQAAAETTASTALTNKVGTIPAQVGETSTPDVVSYVNAKTAAAQAAAVTTADSNADSKIATAVGTIPSSVGAVTTANVKAYVDAKADAAQSAAESTAQGYTDTKVGTIPATVGETSTPDVVSYVNAKAAAAQAAAEGNGYARVLVSATQPADLTENDLWIQDVTPAGE